MVDIKDSTIPISKKLFLTEKNSSLSYLMITYDINANHIIITTHPTQPKKLNQIDFNPI